MKLAVCSDLHLEFGRISLENTENAEVLILSGDIVVANELRERDVYGVMGDASKSNQFHTFFQECCARFPHVIYLAGNHEHYHGDFATTLTILRDRLGYLSNLVILDKEFREINGVMFFGGTLWTDMNKEDPITLNHIKGYMNDYRIIENSNDMVEHKYPIYKKGEDGSFVYEDRDGIRTVVVERHERKFSPAKFSPELSVVEHKETLQALDTAIKVGPSGLPWVVCGHHSPSKLSTKPQYEHDVYVNGAYSSDLSEFMLDRPQIKVWTHGHTHHEFDYMIGSTRVICNPRGYDGYEDQSYKFKLKFFEV
jgi:predicted phosphodiesterase